jgi:hypothetical protein
VFGLEVVVAAWLVAFIAWMGMGIRDGRFRDPAPPLPQAEDQPAWWLWLWRTPARRRALAAVAIAALGVFMVRSWRQDEQEIRSCMSGPDHPTRVACEPQGSG